MAAEPSSSGEEEKGEQRRSAGRGLLLIVAAKAYFIVTSFTIHLVLPRLLETKADYGLYSAAMSVGSIVNNVLVATTILAVSKFVSEDDQNAGSTLRGWLKVQLGMGVLVAGTVFLLAPWIAGGDAAPLVRVICGVTFCYAIYAAFVGSLNGQRKFGKQAALDGTFSTLRTVGLLGGAAIGAGMGLGPLGAMVGFATAAVIITLSASLMVGTGAPATDPSPLSKWGLFLAPLLAYQLALNGILLLDVLVMKHTLTGLASGDGVSLAEAQEAANGYVGLYSAAQKFSFVPYQLMLSMTFIVFPLISRATALGDGEEAKRTLGSAIRLSVLILVAIAAPMSGAADGVVGIVYPAEYAQSADALRILVFGAASFAVFVISATAITGAGRPLTAAVIGFIGLAVVVTGNLLGLNSVGLGDATVQTAATATSVGMASAMLIAAVVVYRRFGAFLPIVSGLRIAVAGVVAFFVAAYVPHDSKLMSILALVAGGLSYLAVLAVSREISSTDLAMVRGILKRK